MKKKNICKYINNIKLKKKLLIINKLIIFLFLITFLLFYYKFYFFVEKNKIIRKYNFKKVKNYLNKCLKGKLNKEINFLNIIKNIDISVIIPVYNSQNTIKNCIISIQAQKKSELEIIIINDFSNDNSKAIIEEMQKKDSRIKIINNSKNMGTLYSRCIGVLLSKGKYIFPLDNDDMFLDQNLLSSIYNESYYFNYDIVGFKALRGNSYNSKISEMYDDEFHMHKNGLILYQPQLSHFSLLNKECHIWGKSIKNRII